MSRLGYLFFLVVSLVSVVSATITVGDRSYASMPAVFGKAWHIMGSYTAHLQLLRENPFLCHGAGLSTPMNERHLFKHHHNDTHRMIVPTDGIPGTHHI